MIRAKMYCSSAANAGRPFTSLTAVYEGSSALQKISENAIFGDATPNGSLRLDTADYGRLANQEEYYIDLQATEPKHAGLLKRRMRQTFRSDYDQSETPLVQFRFVSTEPQDANLELGIRNPAAVEYLDCHRDLWLTIVLASGRKSDEEIALRQAALAEHLTDPYRTKKAHPDSYATQTVRLERALRRSEGMDY